MGTLNVTGTGGEESALEQAARAVGVVSSGSQQLATACRRVLHEASDAARAAKQAVEIAESTNVAVAKLSENSAVIESVVKSIGAIAEQTNLLALNATIEAARAGEAGKGFAIVASEVKELAKATAQATDEISAKIEAIQEVTRVAMAAIARVGEMAQRIQADQESVVASIQSHSASLNEVSRAAAEATSALGVMTSRGRG
jgi:methyl-accepting chemotaxis protein